MSCWENLNKTYMYILTQLSVDVNDPSINVGFFGIKESTSEVSMADEYRKGTDHK